MYSCADVWKWSRSVVSNSLRPCGSWTIKKAEPLRIDAFELWCWRRLLRVLWTSRRSNQSILKEISPRCSLEGLMLKLKLQYFGHLMWRADSLEKTLMLGKIEGRKRRGWERMRWLDGITNLMDMNLGNSPGIGDGQGGQACCNPCGHRKSDKTERLNWTEEYYNLFWSPHYPKFSKEKSLQAGFCVLLTFPQSFFKNFLSFWNSMKSQAHLAILLPQPWKQPFLQGGLVTLTTERCLEAKIWRKLGMLNPTGVIQAFSATRVGKLI